ncbi:MAG: hypothetical protein QXS01_04445, partial [Candidatus Bathyarchaeia archaeon]
WREKAKEVLEEAQRTGKKVLTSAEFLGQENLFLEAKRKALFVDYPPSKEFEKWARQGINAKKRTKPPI